MEDLKKKYNATLKRFEKGCAYLGEHKNEIPKYVPEIIKIVKDLGIMIDIDDNTAIKQATGSIFNILLIYRI